MRAKEMNLGTDPVGKLILKLALPAVAAQVINLLYNMVDRMYVGGMADTGTDALAGLGIVLPITLIVSAFANLVGMGGAPLAGIFLGENNGAKANRVFNTGVTLLLIFGAGATAVLLTSGDALIRLFGAPDSCFTYASDYLFIYGCGSIFVLLALGLNPFITTQGRSVTSMMTVLIGALLNIALDPIFIFTLNMGVRGAALATVLSQGVSAVWVVVFFCRKNSAFRFRFKQLLPHPETALKILALGLSPFIMTVTESAIQIVFNINLNRYSGGDSDYIAAMTIMLSAVQITCLPLNGLGAGIQPLISFNYGSGNSTRIYKTVKIITFVSLACSASVWLLSLTAPQMYGYLFSASDSVMAILKKYTPFFMMGTVMFFAQMTLQNVFIALNQAKISIFLACLRKIILLIPLCFLLPLAFGTAGVFYSEGIADLLAGVTTAATFFALLPRILKKRQRALAASAPEAAQDTTAAD